MQKAKENEGSSNSFPKQSFSGTDSQKVKKQIENDVKNGQGAMTSREAGGRQG
ncbi:hypothetical protein [Saliterribacillus persicus]|uniref:Small, acid-soluble spore protein gamma-type n=1 Tax=Saliterribacillus persicus TaxID=930114 RepID=A0A368X6V6_9BACI|nr:hypothetical protein [Saliterribacillus persicus]RCW63730.1 hypothetical protein DFR57_1167 [Saliterribacillus persicus]